jgi:hypothetical protein
MPDSSRDIPESVEPGGRMIPEQPFKYEPFSGYRNQDLFVSFNPNPQSDFASYLGNLGDAITAMKEDVNSLISNATVRRSEDTTNLKYREDYERAMTLHAHLRNLEVLNLAAINELRTIKFTHKIEREES